MIRRQEVEMSNALFAVIVVAWLLVGVALSVVLGRRGHDGVSWLILGILLGPLSALLAVDVVRHDEGLAVETVGSRTITGPADGIDVLVGYDDSPDAKAVIETVIGLLGSRLRCLTLARVLPFDGGPDDDVAARAALVAEAGRHSGTPVELEIIRGRPASALLEAASAGHFDLLAIGAVGSSHSLLFGTTTRPLSQEPSIPVLICSSKPS
jgi:nucleotide-binding universal stress UspA family protein